MPVATVNGVEIEYTDSGARASAFTYRDSAADVLALLDHLGVERAVLAGMSQGGFLSLRAALNAPHRTGCGRWC